MQVILDSFDDIKPKAGRKELMGLLCVCKADAGKMPRPNASTCKP